ncbi:MAG: TetR/AcrR family transcriptional regulator [Proteobacteria bacterium]|nr:TetR/AcrR family transcriptional regulator [Pseudomonadota bacterium]
MAHRKKSDRTHPNTSRRPGRPAGRTTTDGVIADRDTLLTAAEQLIRQKGPEVSLEAIATEAGVTKPTLYREVGDRDALVNALADRLAVRMAESSANLVARATDPREGLRSLVTGYLDLAARDRHLYLFVTAGGSRDDRVQQSLRLADGAAVQLAKPIAAYRAGHGADPAVAVVWSYALLGALHFVTLWWLRDQGDVDSVIDQITSLVWSGMGLEANQSTG